MAGSLILGACASPARTTTTSSPSTSTKPLATSNAPSPTLTTTSSEKPQYGGQLNLLGGFGGVPQTYWDPVANITGLITCVDNENLWEGDWTKGPAGSDQTDWGLGDNDLFAYKLGYIAESWKWTVDSANDTGTIVYQIKQGVHWALNQNSEASRLVGGREVTADDVVFSLERAITYQHAFIYQYSPELKAAEISKTGPWEVTVTLPLTDTLTGLSRFGDAAFIVPPEVVKKYGDMMDWHNLVGTGPFMLTDYVADSSATLVKNPNYWMKNPIGPGKGDQLPYLDGINVLFIPDVSTQEAAFRTGKMDQMTNIPWEEATQLKTQAPDLIEHSYPSFQGRSTPLFMRTDQPPFNNIDVREALNMAIDRQGILNSQYGGHGSVNTFPYTYVKGYDDLYVNPTDADYPAAAKDIYSFNPDKAKQLLAQAGYPNGFKTTLLITQPEVDYYSIVKQMWANIGVDVTFDIKDLATESALQASGQYNMTTFTSGPVAVFYASTTLNPASAWNFSKIEDPEVTTLLDKVRLDGVTNLDQAMKDYRDLTIYLLPKAYVVPNVVGSVYTMWWPWIENYDGEFTVGYDRINWPQFIWLNQGLKKSMGY